jgi:Lon protease-like protein
MDEELLPLFPLQVVLFPHAALPLHIFEERYRTLLRKSIRESAEFGFVETEKGEHDEQEKTQRAQEAPQGDRADEGQEKISTGE